MKAVILNENGGTEKLIYTLEAKIPEIQPNEVLIQNKATSVNRADIVIRNGYPGLVLHFPHILGGDITGEIINTGEDVRDFKVGDRVAAWPIVACGKCEWCKKGRKGLCYKWKYFGMHMNGSYAEFSAVPESSLVKLPDNVSFEDAASLPVAGLTAYHGLHMVSELRKGDSFFIWGGSSGLGFIAIQLAKNIGATVFATVGDEKKMEQLKKYGADHVFNHNNKEQVTIDVMSLTDNYGVDVLMDYVGPEAHPYSFRMVKKGGKILWCGILTGRETMVNMHQTYLRHISLLGMYLGEKEELESLVKLVSEGKVKPYIGDTFELKDAGKAHGVIANGQTTGKIILKI